MLNSCTYTINTIGYTYTSTLDRIPRKKKNPQSPTSLKYHHTHNPPTQTLPAHKVSNGAQHTIFPGVTTWGSAATLKKLTETISNWVRYFLIRSVVVWRFKMDNYGNSRTLAVELFDKYIDSFMPFSRGNLLLFQMVGVLLWEATMVMFTLCHIYHVRTVRWCGSILVNSRYVTSLI